MGALLPRSGAARPIQQHHGAQAGERSPACAQPRQGRGFSLAQETTGAGRGQKRECGQAHQRAAAFRATNPGVRRPGRRKRSGRLPRPKVIEAAEPNTIPIKTVNGRISSGSYTLGLQASASLALEGFRGFRHAVYRRTGTVMTNQRGLGPSVRAGLPASPSARARSGWRHCSAPP